MHFRLYKYAGAEKVRQELLFKDINDKWVQIAALSAGSSQSVALLNGVLSKFDPSVKAYASLVQLLGGIIGKSQDATVINQLIHRCIADSTIKSSAWGAPLLEGFVRRICQQETFAGRIGRRTKITYRNLFGKFFRPHEEERPGCFEGDWPARWRGNEGGHVESGRNRRKYTFRSGSKSKRYRFYGFGRSCSLWNFFKNPDQPANAHSLFNCRR